MNRPPPSLTLLAIASGMSPFGMAILLPALPDLAMRFDASYAEVQWVISGYLFGIAFTQPIVGNLCDRFGRRPVFLCGLTLFVLSSLGLSTAVSLPALVGLRFLQAVGAGTGTVVCRAMIRDLFPPEQGARAMSALTIGLGVAPVIAPMVGGWLLAVASFHALFLFTAGCALVVLLYIALRLPETLHPEVALARKPPGLESYLTLLGSRPFLGFTLIFGFVQGSFFAFLAVGAAVFETSFGIGPAAFGMIWGTMATAFVLGALVGGKLSVTKRRERVLPVSVTLTLMAGGALYLLVAAGGVELAAILIPMSVMMLLSGIITPVVMAGAVFHHPDIAGTSAGFSSALGLILGSSFTIVAGFIYSGNFVPIAGLIAAATTLTWLSWFIVRGYDTVPAKASSPA